MFTFYKALASNPTIAPGVVGAVDIIDGYRLGYRIKTDSGVTALSPLTADAYALPVTVTFPAYADAPPGFAYELVALSAGTYYSLGVTTATTLTLANAPINSPIAYISESFAPGLPDPDLGVFSSTSSPTVVFYAKYQGAAASGAIVDVLKGSAERATELFGQVMVSYLGNVGDAGSVDISAATSIFWDDGIKSTNTLEFPINSTGIYKFSLTLTGYAPTGFAVMATNSFRLELYTTPKTYPYPSPYAIPTPSLFYTKNTYVPTLTSGGGVASVSPFRLYVYGRMLVVPSSQTISLPSTADRIAVSLDGSVRALLPTDTLMGDKEFLLLKLNGAVWQPACNFVAPVVQTGVAGTGATFVSGQVVYLNTTNFTLSSSSTSVTLGVALNDAVEGGAVSYASNGVALVKTTAGALLGVGSAISAQMGDYRLYVLNSIAPTSGSVGNTNLSVSNRTGTTLTVDSDTGAGAVIPAASTTEAGLLTAADKVAYDAVVAGGGGSGGGGGVGALVPSSLVAFGDSHTVGIGASTLTDAYISKVVANTGWALTNRAVSSTEVIDQADLIYAENPSVTTQYTWLSGFNDLRNYKSSTAGKDTFSSALKALAAWLAIPATKRTKAQSGDITYSGTWADSPKYGGTLSKESSTASSTATFSFTGDSLLVGYTRIASGTGDFSISVDGAAPVAVSGSSALASASGRPYAPTLAVVTSLYQGFHTATITVASGSITLDWVAGISSATPGYSGPNLFLGNTIRMNPVAVPSLGQTAIDSLIGQYNGLIKGVAQDLEALGLDVRYVNANDRFDLADISTDNIHPGDAGHLAIAEAFIDKIRVTPGLLLNSGGSGSGGGGAGVSNGDPVIGSQPAGYSVPIYKILAYSGDGLYSGGAATRNGSNLHAGWNASSSSYTLTANVVRGAAGSVSIWVRTNGALSTEGIVLQFAEYGHTFIYKLVGSSFVSQTDDLYQLPSGASTITVVVTPTSVTFGDGTFSKVWTDSSYGANVGVGYSIQLDNAAQMVNFPSLT